MSARTRQFRSALFRSATLCVALSLCGPIAHAQPSPTEEARVRAERALTLFDEGRYDAALVELREAYRIAPSAGVLYNLGRIHEMRGDWPAAVESYERFLRDGSADDPRRDEVTRRLDTLRARVGAVAIVVEPAGAEILVDGAPAVDATGAPRVAPLEAPLRLAVGRHRVGARAPTFANGEREIDVAGLTEQRVELRLQPVSVSTLQVETNPVGARIMVDGVEHGMTPLAGVVSVEPGRHVLVATRAGYHDARQEVTVAPGETAASALALERDHEAREILGSAALHLPSASCRVRLDGEATDLLVEAPAGPHRLEIEVADRQPVTMDIDIVAGARVDVRPRLEWLPEARERRVASAADGRATGWAVLVAGLVAFAASVPVIGVAVSERDRLAREADVLREAYDSCTEPGCGIRVRSEFEGVVAAHDQWNTGLISASVLGALATVAAVSGGIVVALVPSEEAIDGAASATLRLGHGVALDVRF